MTTKTAGSNIPTTTTHDRLTTGSVTSKDGTTIGYYQIGQGPALIILHGSMESGLSHLQLAESLSDSFTVYLPDRRARGLSGAYAAQHSVEKDVEDMEALLIKTGAKRVLGVSSGAIIWLKAALSLPIIEKAVIFEPPISINGSVSMDFMAQYDEEIAQGKLVDALTTGMLAAEMGPAFLRKLPRWFLNGMTTLMMKAEERSASPTDVTMRKLAPTLHYDFYIVKEVSPDVDSFKGIQSEVLLLGGDQSPAYLKTSVRALEKILPNVKRIELSGVGHGATGNTNRGGDPKRVAEVLRSFLA